MLTSDFDFDLPAELIAQQPAPMRDQSRLMVVNRQARSIEHRVFLELPELLRTGDVLVRNNSRVVRARLVGKRALTGGHWEGLFLRSINGDTWEILASTRGHADAGEWFDIATGLRLQLIERGEAGRWLVRLEPAGNAYDLLERHGMVPLPPYIRKGREQPEDSARYQTTFALVPGSVAAPTAGLHFTPHVFSRLHEQGVQVADLTLHVGIGTFRPIETETIEHHVMHGEWAELHRSEADRLNAARVAGGRVVAVGTTSARTLETAVRGCPARFESIASETNLFIRPGHRFQGIDALVTNFHLPRSSLLVLVSAFAGFDLTRKAYEEAIARRYRFYSYGDAMIIL